MLSLGLLYVYCVVQLRADVAAESARSVALLLATSDRFGLRRRGRSHTVFGGASSFGRRGLLLVVHHYLVPFFLVDFFSMPFNFPELIEA